MNEEKLRRRYGGHVPGLLGAEEAFAVLCPLVGDSLLFEVRAANLRQGGEVCFPGGRVERGESPAACALRETEEELSIPRETVEILGLGDFICNQRGFLLQPVVGIVSREGMARLRPSPAEVAEAFLAPLSFFRETEPSVYYCDLLPHPPGDLPYESLGISRDYPWSRGRIEIPVWRYEGRTIWGMTARLVRDLVKGG